MQATLPTLDLTIGAVERETGLSKDILRMWERRSGFPDPRRDAHGERIYPLEQVDKLRLVKRLMDQGHRPGKIIGRPVAELMALASVRPRPAALRQELEIVLGLIRSHQLAELRRHLSQTLMRRGLHAFVMETVAPLNEAVGEAWMRGEFAVFEEHLYTEQIQSLLRNAVNSIQPQQGRAPRVLLTSFPQEPHGLGLLMVEALLALEGASCIPLGTEMPLQEIARAAQAHHADVVALSFSGAFNEKQAAQGLSELRELLPAGTAMWAGGAGLARLRRPLAGVEIILDLDELGDRVKAWRDLNASQRIEDGAR